MGYCILLDVSHSVPLNLAISLSGNWMINVITAMISKVFSPRFLNNNSYLGAGRMTAILELSHLSSGNLRDFFFSFFFFLFGEAQILYKACRFFIPSVTRSGLSSIYWRTHSVILYNFKVMHGWQLILNQILVGSENVIKSSKISQSFHLTSLSLIYPFPTQYGLWWSERSSWQRIENMSF